MAEPPTGPPPQGAARRDWQNPRDHLLPATFEERGAAVPFTTLPLVHARIRKGWRDGLELMIGDFAESGGAYVVPFASVREMVTLTAHDAMLFELILERRATDPDAVRLCALETARTGLAGEAAADQARRVLAGYESALAFHQILIILDVIREVEGQAVERFIHDIKTPEGQDRARAALGAIGARLSMTPAAFDARIAELAAITFPAGLRTNPERGRLRLLYERLVDFELKLRLWGAERTGEAAAEARFASDVAAHTLGIASEVLQRIDRLLDRPFVLLQGWQEQQAPLAALGRRLAWLLDGWSIIVEMWFAARTTAEEVATLNRLIPVLPLVPRDEVNEVRYSLLNESLQRTARRWVRAHVDWRTGELDHEMIERIESAKARSL